MAGTRDPLLIWEGFLPDQNRDRNDKLFVIPRHEGSLVVREGFLYCRDFIRSLNNKSTMSSRVINFWVPKKIL